MYGLGLAKGLTITMKNMLKPGRMFTIHQYPDRKIGLIGLAKMAGTNPIFYALKHHNLIIKHLSDSFSKTQTRIRQHMPRFGFFV